MARLHDERVEALVLDAQRQGSDTVGEEHRKPHSKGDEAVEQRHILQAPAAYLPHGAEKDHPQQKKQKVLQEHEAAHKQRAGEIGVVLAPIRGKQRQDVAGKAHAVWPSWMARSTARLTRAVRKTMATHQNT